MSKSKYRVDNHIIVRNNHTGKCELWGSQVTALALTSPIVRLKAGIDRYEAEYLIKQRIANEVDRALSHPTLKRIGRDAMKGIKAVGKGIDIANRVRKLQ